jgi:ABC-type transport system involved in cytochrome c biogenesis permease subunit
MTLRNCWPVLAAAATASLYVGANVIPSAEGPLHLRAAGSIPVVAGGRIKPLDSVARSTLIIVSGRQTFTDVDGVQQPAIRWLLDVMASGDSPSGPAAQPRIFRIENDQLLKLLDLPARPGSYRYSLEEIGKHFEALKEEAGRVMALKKKQAPLELFDQKIWQLWEHLEVYIELAGHEKPLAVPPESVDEDWRSLADVNSDVKERVGEKIRAELTKQGLDLDKLTPEQQADLYRRVSQEASATERRVSPAAAAWTEILAAYRAARADRASAAAAAQFNEAVANYGQYLADVPARDQIRARVEQLFNRVEPFYHCLVLYVIAFFLAALSWVGGTSGGRVAGTLRRAAVGLTVTTVIIHTAALIVRMYLMDRPFVFVTNLYSTAIFIGWACVLVGLLVEWLYGMGLGAAVAAVAGTLSLIIAHNLALATESGDTLEMLQAVLDTNFWLATHVTTVNLGYAATFAAGLFGIAYVVLGLTTRALAGPLGKTMAQIVYGVVCFGTLTSFVGTVLGGIWADQSWGRFWGWDPKENGALLIVIWNAMILHARWAGLIKARGVATLAVLGNIIVIWSWFATNELGIGLHSYGASEGSKRLWIDVAWGVHLALGLTAALVPARYWPSFNPAAQKAALAARKANPQTA